MQLLGPQLVIHYTQRPSSVRPQNSGSDFNSRWKHNNAEMYDGLTLPSSGDKRDTVKGDSRR